MSDEETTPLEETKSKVLIKLRGYKIKKKKEFKNATGFFVSTREGKGLVYSIPSQGTVGVAYVNQLVKILEEEKLERAMVVTGGRYTQAARKKAKVNNIELIPRIFPPFNIFEHRLVPVHEILSPEEKEELLSKYRAQPYQLPRIKTSDPGVKAIGAKVGDVVRIIRESPTAGKYVAYRYVVPDS